VPMSIQEAKKQTCINWSKTGVQIYIHQTYAEFKEGRSWLSNAAVLIPGRFGGHGRQAGSVGTHTKMNRMNGSGSNQYMSPIYSSFIFRYSRKHNIAHQTVVGACARTGVRKRSTNTRLAEGGLEGGKNWCTMERGVHYSREERACGALCGVEAMARLHPVELCTTGDYNYSEYCTFTNLQLQFFIALLWSIRLFLCLIYLTS